MMNISAELKLSTKDKAWLCFRHAVKSALQGGDVKMEIDVFDDYYLGPTWCEDCDKEREEPK